MKKENHGTTPQINGIYVEFQATILRALPRDISPDTQLEWTRNGKVLACILREVLMPPDGKLDPNSYYVSVDYGRNVENAEASSLYPYEWFDPRINSKDFLTRRRGKKASLKIELISFDRDISTNEVLRQLDRMDFRPAELHELLAFADKYGGFRSVASSIVALGSMLQDKWGDHVPCLIDKNMAYPAEYDEYVWSQERNLELENCKNSDWGKKCRFAAVHNPT